MEETPNTKGFTKVCAYCRHIILSRGTFFGFGSFRMKCANPECFQYNTLSFTQEAILKVSKFLVIIIVIGYITAGFFDEIQARKNVVCREFIGSVERDSQHLYSTDWEYAQALLKDGKHGYLDGDNDGIACEILLK